MKNPKTFSLRLLFCFCTVFFFCFTPNYSAGTEFEIVATETPQNQKISSSKDSADEVAEFEIVSKESAAKKTSAAGEELFDVPGFEIVRRSGTGSKSEYERKKAEYDKEKEAYDELIREKERLRNFGPFHYSPLENTINGMDARLFITLTIVSLVAVLSMLYVLIREYGFIPPVYSLEQMQELRNAGYASVSKEEADAYVNSLWHTATAGQTVKEDQYIDIDNRGDLCILSNELQITAATLPVNSSTVDKLNRIAEAICFWKKRHLVCPGISIDSGMFKRIVMAVIYVVLLYIYVNHPMYLLVVFCPLAFWSPAYLVEKRENSWVYRMLGGSLKIFGKVTGNAFSGAANMEGASVTVYKSTWGNTAYVEHNYWGVLIVFLIKIAFALFLLYLIFMFAPFLVLYAVIRNYILAK